MSEKNWPAWFYGPKGESQIFHSEADVPKGWADSPAKHSREPKGDSDNGAADPDAPHVDVKGKRGKKAKAAT